MEGLYAWPDIEEDRKWMFKPNSSSGDAACFVWEKPRGFSFFFFLCGAAGGGGGSGAQASTGHGGPGGGSGGVMTLLMPAILVPDKLFFKVGPGGAGATPGSNNAVDGGHSFICLTSRFNGGDYFCRCTGGVAGSYGGGANSGGSGGAAGQNGSTLFPYLTGMYQTIPGVSGRTGLEDSNGSQTLTWANAQLNFGGLAGAGTSNTTDYKGEGFTGPDPGFTPAANDIAGGASGGGKGDPGWFLMAPFLSAPGCGGGSNHAGTAGNGGDGGLTSGGGGSGQGTTAGTGGRGGDGVSFVVGM